MQNTTFKNSVINYISEFQIDSIVQFKEESKELLNNVIKQTMSKKRKDYYKKIINLNFKIIGYTFIKVGEEVSCCPRLVNDSILDVVEDFNIEHFELI